MKQKLFRWAMNPLAPVLTVVFLMSGIAYAQTPPTAPVLVSSYGSLNSLWCPIFNVMFWVLMAVSIIMIFWAAFLYATSEGESEKPSQARKMILYAAIGIVIALIAKGAPAIVASIFGQTDNNFTWSC